ncbi:tRNA 2-thiouridine(34) synthase MnmA [Candidatus Saccharibacteria bacterium]|nr:tRNA 2-thiouridine(34) synthase MnmA [Candidatus Saccharibacteria bacterium]
MKVFLGMSGGVDSAVSAHLLKQQGHEVTGVYMKNWSKNLPGMKCPWAEDLADAKRVAVRLGLDFRVFDFEAEYKQKVVDYMITEYQKGNTPNPDIMCNQEIKFKLFADTAFEQGAEAIATGHYAKTDQKNLLCAKDTNKDQTYFLYRISAKIIPKTFFPVGDFTKPEVKQLAKDLNLPVANKSESMGVCFVGEANMRDFLSEYIETKPGEIREFETNQLLGRHDGAIFYTLGQRHGLNLTAGLPYYVVNKDMSNNIVYVSRNLNHASLWQDKVFLDDLFLRSEIDSSEPLLVRIRHRAPLVEARFDAENQILTFSDPQKSLTPGQSIVFYQGQICLGGGIISPIRSAL